MVDAGTIIMALCPLSLSSPAVPSDANGTVWCYLTSETAWTLGQPGNQEEALSLPEEGERFHPARN